MGVVNHDPGLAPVRGGADRRQLCQIAIHAEDPIGHHQGIAGGLVQAFFQTVHVIVQVAGKTGAAQQAGVQQGGMIQSILQHGIALPYQRGDNTEVGGVAAGHQQHPRPPGEFGQGLFQLVMRFAVPDHQMGRPTTHTPAAHTLDHRLGHGRMVGQPQIIIAAESQQRLAIDADVYILRRGQQRPLAVKMGGTALGQPSGKIKGHRNLCGEAGSLKQRRAAHSDKFQLLAFSFPLF